MSEDSIGSSMYTIGERKNNKYLKEIDISILTDSIMEKYSKQLDYYSEALFKMINKKVTKRYLYSFYLEKNIEV